MISQKAICIPSHKIQGQGGMFRKASEVTMMAVAVMMDQSHEIEDILLPRRLTNDFLWFTWSWVGAPYFVRGSRKLPKELVSIVLKSPNIRVAIKEISSITGKSDDELRKEAVEILDVMAHNFRMYAIRWLGITLSIFWKNLYHSIQVNCSKIEQIKEAYKSYPVLLLPTHRSYVDFLLLSFVSFHYQLPLPTIAAGMDFKYMVGIGEILRKAGAFFIRRRFGSDLLYWALISEYVKKAVLEGGRPLEMFIEGTRSRSGKSLKPKIGLLSTVLDLVRNSEIPDILILPISISYDRTLEERLHAHELLGRPKPKESTTGLIRAVSWLTSQSYGSMYMSFGDIISARDILSKEPFRSNDESFRRGVENIASTVILEHQKFLAIPLFSVISLILMSKVSKDEFTIQLKDLLSLVESIECLLSARGSKFGYPLRRESLEANILFILRVHSELVILPKNTELVTVNVAPGPGDPVQHMVFQHYANQSLNVLFPLSVISLLAQLDGRVPNKQDSDDLKLPNHDLEALPQIRATPKLKEQYLFLRQMFQEEFVYQRGTEEMEIQVAIDILNSWTRTNTGSLEKEVTISSLLRDTLSTAMQPFIIAYWGMAKLWFAEGSTASPIDAKTFEKKCQDFLLKALKDGHLPNHYGALSLEALSNATAALVRAGALKNVKLEDGLYGIVISKSELLGSIVERLAEFISSPFPGNEAINSEFIVIGPLPSKL